MGKYNVGEVWWTQFPFEDRRNESKRRPAIVVDDNTIAILTMMVTSKDKSNPYSIKIDDWKQAGLTVESWARIDRIIRMDEWRMESKIGLLSNNDLKKFIELMREYLSETFHEFSLVAIRRDDGRFLQIFDERWQSWLFPYYRSVDPKKQNIDIEIGKLFHQEIDVKYEDIAIHCKYSVSDEVYKQYKHTLYSLKLDKVPDFMTEAVFELNGKRYAWKSISELENDSDVMDKNDDVLAFVKKYC